MSVPYSSSPAPPTEIFKVIFEGKFFYMLYFQPVGPAEAEFEADPRHFLRTMLYAASGEGMAGAALLPDVPREGTRFLDILPPAPEVLPAWLTETDVDVYAAAFEKSGFFGPVSFYRNMDANWERIKDIPAVRLHHARRLHHGLARPGQRHDAGCGRGHGRGAARLPRRHRGRGGRPLGATGAAGRDQRRAAGVPRHLEMSDLAPLPAQPAGVPWPTESWPTGPAPSGVNLAPLLDEAFDEAGPLATSYAVLVVHGGKVVAERYGGALEHFDRTPTPVTAEVPLLSWSMAKSMLHAVVGLLVGAGRLDLDAPAQVPEWAAPDDPRPRHHAAPAARHA